MHFTQFPCLPQRSFIVCASVCVCMRVCVCVYLYLSICSAYKATLASCCVHWFPHVPSCRVAERFATKWRQRILKSFHFINYNLLLRNSPHDWSALLHFVITINLLNFRRYEIRVYICRLKPRVVVLPHLLPCCLHSFIHCLCGSCCFYYCSLLLGAGNMEMEFLGKFIVFCSAALVRRDSACV